jgi:hypothetical protein
MPIDEDAFRIRAAQSHRFRHLRDDVPTRLDLAIVAHPTGYAAHRVTSLARPRCRLAREVGAGGWFSRAPDALSTGPARTV